MYEEMTDRWVLLNKSKILKGMENGYKPDRYSDKDVEDVVGMFDYYASTYLIGTNLFQSIMREILPFMFSNLSLEQIKQETDQIIIFCKLGDYGQGIFTDNIFDSMLIDLMDEYRSVSVD